MNVVSLAAAVSVNVDLSLPALTSTAGRAQFELRAGPFMQRELEVVSFVGKEMLNAPYVYDVTFDSSVDAGALQAGTFGFPACFSMLTATEKPQVIQGLAVGVDPIGAANSERGKNVLRYSMRLVPRLWLLGHCRNYRVFEDQSPVDIACAVFKAGDIEVDVRLERGEYPPLPFVYQCGETDLAFVTHVLATAGIWFYFEHANGFLDQLIPGAGQVGALIGGLVGGVAGEIAQAIGATTKLVLCDMSRRTTPIPGSSPVAVVGAAVGAALREVGGAVADTLDAAVEAATGAVAVLPYDHDGEAATASERVFAFRARTEVRPKVATVRAWDPAAETGVEFTAGAPAVAVNGAGGLTASVGLGASVGASVGVAATLGTAVGAVAAGIPAGLAASLDVDAIGIPSAAVAVSEYQRDGSLLAARDPLAARALSQLRADRVTAQGESDSRRLAPGYRFRLARHPIAHVNTEYVVTAVRSSGWSPDHAPPDHPHLYLACFDCVPSTIDPRPPKPAPRPPLGLETATVVGPAYGQVHCDKLGRIRVRFHWPTDTMVSDADADADADATEDLCCWVGWLERLAGNGYGTLTMPRVGSEVWVGFPQGEGGRPVAIGQHYGGTHVPPFALPEEAHKVGVRSQVLPDTDDNDGGYSAIVIDDLTGNVHLRAQKDLEVEVLGDRRVHVRGNAREDVDGSLTQKIGGTARSEIGGESSRVVTGSEHVHVTGDADTSIGGTKTLAIGGAARATVADDASLDAGRAALNVADDLRVAVAGSTTTDVSGDDIRTIGRRQVTTVGGGPAAGSEMLATGSYTLAVSNELVLESAKSLTLRCGTAELRLTPQTISLLANTIQSVAAKELSLSGPGPSLVLSDTLSAAAKQLSLQSSGGRLELGDTAKLLGKVQLGSTSTDSTPPSSSSAAAPRPLSFRVIDATGQPLANATYQLFIANTMSQGTTDAAGHVTASVPADVSSLRLVVWLDSFPEGPCVTYVVNVEPMSAPSSLAGAQVRLRNLGYYSGSITGRLDTPTRDALLLFQHHQGLPATGQIDDATASALTTQHP